MDKKHLLLIGTAALILLLLIQTATATWVNTSFTRRAPILINNTGNATNLTDHQVFLNITYDSDMQSDFDDIRIYNQTHFDLYGNESNSIIAYWNESKSDGNWSNMWGNYTYLNASAWTNDTYYLYYNNLTVLSASNGSATFEFFDDFDGTSLDTDKWTNFDASIVVANSIITVTATAASWQGPMTNLCFGPYNHAFRGKIKYSDVSRGCSFGGTNNLQGSDDNMIFLEIDGVFYLDTRNEGAVTQTIKTSEYTLYHIDELQWINGNVKFYRDGEFSGEHTTNIPDEALQGVFSAHTSADISADWALVRKYASPEPNALLGAEEPYGVETTPSISNVTNGSINATSHWVAWDVNQTAYNRWKYSLYENMSSPSWSAWQNNTASPNITVTTLTENTKYYYQAWSHNTINTSLTDNSTTANFTTPAAGTPPSLSNQTPSTPVTSRYATPLTFSATSNQSSNNEWLLNGTLQEWDNATASPSYTNSTAKVGVYNVTLIAHNAINHSLTDSMTWIWTVSLKPVPSIVDGVYGILNSSIPSNATILDYKNESLLTIESTFDWDAINSTTWNSYKNSIQYCYDNHLRSALRMNCGGAYNTTSYDDSVKDNITTYLPDLKSDPYQIDMQYIVINLTNTTAPDSEKTSFVNTIATNISEQTGNAFKTVLLEDLTGLDDDFVSKTPVIYITLTNISNWIDDEALTLRGNSTLSRVYTGNETFLSNLNDHRVKIISKMRSRTNISNQYTEDYSVKLLNGDIILYNNQSTSVNRTVANADSGYYWALHNDTMVNLSGGGTLGFWIPAKYYGYEYLIKETLDKIMYVTNETSQLWGATTTTDVDQVWHDGIMDGNSAFSAANFDIRAEFWDPSYTKEKTFMIHYEWINASAVTNYTIYDYIIIADKNSNEINNTINRINDTYGYISVEDYEDTDAWQNNKTAEIDDWIDNYSVNVFIDGIDFAPPDASASVRLKALVDHTQIDKGKKAIMNTYTFYQNYSTYGDAVMKESAFARWDGDVNDPTYSWEDMTIEKDRADFYTSHNIPVLGISYGNQTDYDKQAFCFAAFAVLYGFESNNSWRYGQPNFQNQRELRVYDLGTMLEPSYTETSSTDWNRLYQAGRIHINPVNHTWHIDDNKEVNNISIDFSLYSDSAGSGDRNVYVFSNTNDTIHTIPYLPGDPTGTWVWRTAYLNTTEFNEHGHYYIYAYTRPPSGGWTNIAYATSSEGAKTWYDTTAENLPTTTTGQTWTSHTGGANNYMINLSVNFTTSKYLDDLTNRINQSTTRVAGNNTLTLNATRDIAVPAWTGTINLTTVSTAKTYVKNATDVWTEINVSTVSDASASDITWNYTTVDSEQYGAVKQIVDATHYIYRYLLPHTSVQEVLTEENVPPVLDAIGDKSVVVGDWLNFTVTATDENNDTLTFSDNSTLFSINSSTGNVNYSATKGEGGIYYIDFGVSDGHGGTDNETITLTVTDHIYPSANEWILMNNWDSNQTFAQIDATLTNDTSYTYYNGTEWFSYVSGYGFNNDTVIPKNESAFIFFNASTTITRVVSTNDISIIGSRWFYTFIPDYTSKNLTTISTSMASDGGDIWELYAWDNSTQSYTTTGSHTVNPNEGLVVYSNNTFTWTN